jgi:hypothetical protein
MVYLLRIWVDKGVGPTKESQMLHHFSVSYIVNDRQKFTTVSLANALPTQDDLDWVAKALAFFEKVAFVAVKIDGFCKNQD